MPRSTVATTYLDAICVEGALGVGELGGERDGDRFGCLPVRQLSVLAQKGHLRLASAMDKLKSTKERLGNFVFGAHKGLCKHAGVLDKVQQQR